MPPQLDRNPVSSEKRRVAGAGRAPIEGWSGSPGPVITGASQSLQPRPPTEQYARIENIRDAWKSLESEWLSTAERSELDRLRNFDRRQAWLGGRWLAKNLIREACAVSTDDPASIEILSRGAAGKSIRPQVMIDKRPAAVCLSISHSPHGVLAAVTTRPETTVGVDLEIPELPKPGFLRTWFTAAERETIDGTDPRQIATRWAIKEAVYKACNAGESFAPRNIEVFDSAAGRPLCYYRGSDLNGRCKIEVSEIDGHVAVVAILTHHERQ